MTKSTETPTPVTVGTAGHIDHGKTRLVERLTGMRADRPYERERGMTIDIGYAEMTTDAGRRVGFVDLPGHERFIRNMVAGATGIDLALLVVAADDGVMPQTREHVEILGLLGIRRALAVLNKVDTVDQEMRELALEELTEFLAETSLRGAPVLCCSAETGEGIDEVKRALLELVGEGATDPDPGSFFLAVQRSFAAQGFGCIATGVPAAGQVAIGDELELLPAAKKARVRGIEIYHAPSDHARAGHRTALNLAGIRHDEVGRGMVVAEPGVFLPSRFAAAELTLLARAKRPLKHAAGVRLLTGTLEEMAQVYLLSGEELMAGESALVELRTRQPFVVRDGDPFILRSDNAVETLGGGRIVTGLAQPIGRRNKAMRQRLERWAGAWSDPRARLHAAIELDGPAPPTVLARACRLRREAAADLLAAMRADGELVVLPGGAYAPAAAVAVGSGALLEALTAAHAEQPLLAALPLAEVRDRAGLAEALLQAVLAELGDRVVVAGRTVRLASHSVTLDEGTRRAAAQLVRSLADAAFAPPKRGQLGEATGLGAADLEKALTLLIDQDALREVAPGLLYTTKQLDRGLRLLRAIAERRGSFEPVDAKAALGGISRKWLIPLLEFYDRIGATRRDGNQRKLTPKGERLAEKGIDAT